MVQYRSFYCYENSWCPQRIKWAPVKATGTHDVNMYILSKYSITYMRHKSKQKPLKIKDFDLLLQLD